MAKRATTLRFEECRTYFVEYLNHWFPKDSKAIEFVSKADKLTTFVDQNTLDLAIFLEQNPSITAKSGIPKLEYGPDIEALSDHLLSRARLRQHEITLVSLEYSDSSKLRNRSRSIELIFQDNSFLVMPWANNRLETLHVETLANPECIFGFPSLDFSKNSILAAPEFAYIGIFDFDGYLIAS